MNAAEYLLDSSQQKNIGTARKKGFTFFEVESALHEVQSVMAMRKSAGEDTDFADNCLSQWANDIVDAFFVNGVNEDSSQTFRTPLPFKSADVYAMKTIASELEQVSLHFTNPQRKKLDTLLAEARSVVAELHSELPDGLVLYVTRLLRETETALDEYKITGDFALERSFARLREALDITIAQTPEPESSKWDGVRKVFAELAIGFVIEAPSIAFAVPYVQRLLGQGQ